MATTDFATVHDQRTQYVGRFVVDSRPQEFEAYVGINFFPPIGAHGYDFPSFQSYHQHLRPLYELCSFRALTCSSASALWANVVQRLQTPMMKENILDRAVL
jgi:hypothetical protein